MADAAASKYGRIDILVNNAALYGALKGGRFETIAESEWDDAMRVNVKGIWQCCKAVVPRMLAGGYGRIVNIASIAGKEGNPNAAHYSAAKAGVIAFTKSLGKELARSNITVNCVAPAVIETDILTQMTPQHVEYMLSRIPMGRFGKKEEAAALVAWLCSRECIFSTAAVFDLSGGRATY